MREASKPTKERETVHIPALRELKESLNRKERRELRKLRKSVRKQSNREYDVPGSGQEGC